MTALQQPVLQQTWPQGLVWKHVALTHQGRRDNNEDAYFADERLGLFVVADGMGGYEGGEVASRAVVESLAALYRRIRADEDATWPFKRDPGLSYEESILCVALRQAHYAIEARRNGRLMQMGSTAVALIARGPYLVVGHVGDSRLYRLRAGRLEALTVDHSFYEDYCRQVGHRVSRHDFAWSNVITRALGTDKFLPDVATFEAALGDRYLLCSDGLIERLDDDTLAALAAHPAPAEAAALLVERAMEAGTKDNTTVILAYPTV